jgi:glycosyltransferase involved in cell wall biosynthesis
MFSVLIANFNNARYLETALQSVFSQTSQDYEVVLVDDGSTDNSCDIAQAYSDKDCRVQLLRNSCNRGVGYTKKRCVEAAVGDVCGFLDPDDALLPDALDAMMKAHADPEIGVVYSNQVNCDQALKPTGRIMERILPEGASLLESGGSFTHFVSFKKKAYSLTDGVAEEFKKAVDVDLYLKLEEVASVRHLPQELYLYRCHPGGISQGLVSEKTASLWSLMARLSACKRRGISPESIIVDFAEREMSEPTPLSFASRIRRIGSRVKSRLVGTRSR